MTHLRITSRRTAEGGIINELESKESGSFYFHPDCLERYLSVNNPQCEYIMVLIRQNETRLMEDSIRGITRQASFKITI